MDSFDSDPSFDSGNSFDSDKYPPYRSTSPSQRSIDELFDQAEKALNDLNVPEPADHAVRRELDPKETPYASQLDAADSLLDPDSHSENTERLYTLKEILESMPNDGSQAVNWESLEDVELDVSVVLGDAEMTMENVMRLKSGAVVPLNAQKNDPVTLVINGQPIAKGEVMTRNGKFCIRITEILSDRF